MTSSQETDVFPTPAFEGSEKRIEIDFACASGTKAAADGLRAIPRESLNTILDLAACCIVSQRHGTVFDAYVLSESSLFVHKRKVILKTCGTTKLLAAVPAFITAAAAIGLQPCRAKYSRASFLFPDQQPDMHACFPGETELLQTAFKTMGGISGAYVLGDLLSGLQWHVFVMHGAQAAEWHKPAYTLEVCMTGLARKKVSHFVRGATFTDSRAATAASGIQALLPHAEIDDYVFEPCGYSMNGISDAQCSTIHVTPEDGYSYASVEVTCDTAPEVPTDELVQTIARIFEPEEMAVVMTVDGEESSSCDKWGTRVAVPAGFRLSCDSRQRFRAGGRVTFATLLRDADVASSGPEVSPQMEHAADDGSESSDTLIYPPLPPEREHECAQQPTYSSDSDTSPCTPTSSLLIASPSLKQSPQQTTAAANADAVIVAVPNFKSPRMPSLPEAVRAVMDAYEAVNVKPADDASMDRHIASLIRTAQLEDTFYVMDLGIVAALHAGWTALLPRVRPFYAVKCNESLALLSTLAAAGACFDCASAAEITAVAALGVEPDRIIFANACKRPCDIRTARAAGVRMTTADSPSELRKLAASYPEAQVLLRVRQDDPSARCQLGNKYGAESEDLPELLTEAKRLSVDLAGVSFHVGSGASNPEALPAGISAAAAVFDAAAAFGFDMRVLDIGGGFPGGAVSESGQVDLGVIPTSVNRALALHFPPSRGIDIIAEPGRFFAEACSTLVCQVIGTRHRSIEAAKATAAGTAVDYYITDGLYGSFNCIMYDHAQPSVRPLRTSAITDYAPSDGSVHSHLSSSSSWELVDNGSGDSLLLSGAAADDTMLSNGSSQHAEGQLPLATEVSSTVFGPSCDGLDVVFDRVALPQLDNGDWLLFPNMGAYTLCGASNFNGIPAAEVPTFYVTSI